MMSKSKSLLSVIVALVVVSLLLFSCTISEEAAPPEEPPPEPQVQASDTAIPEPTSPPPESTEPVEEPVEEPALEPLTPEPQVIEFSAEDGYALKGTYYPASVNPAPVVVLFHQAGFNEEMWQAIAPWLQNRPMGVAALDGGTGGVLARPIFQPYTDPSTFPVIPDDLQVGVFTFTYRCWESGNCSNPDREGWLMDAKAAINTASALPGVDPMRIVTAGTSIGADGAADSCMLYNQAVGSGCLGAASFSPASYLLVDYKETAEKLLAAQLKVICAASQGDGECASTCNSLDDQPGYKKIIYIGSAHGVYMIDPALEPVLLEEFIAFLEERLM